MALLRLMALLVGPAAGSTFNVSNTLGDHMVLQRGPQQAVVWGMGVPGTLITTAFAGSNFSATVGPDSVWRQKLPPQPATKTPQTISFSAPGGATVALADVLFGDVLLCGGQSNMQYTPHSMAGMNNVTVEIAAANAYSATIRFFTVGQETACGDPKKGQVDCSKPFTELDTPVMPSGPGGPCRAGSSCRELWTPASAAAFGNTAWNTFSAVCYLTGRDIHDALDGEVPIGLISSNWGGTPIQVWQPLASVQDCGSKSATVGGSLYNSMIAPFTVGPMALTGLTWYQAESNMMGGCGPTFYECAFPSMITRWREAFGNPKLWFGFVQVAGWGYSHPYGNPPKPEADHSRCAGDVRQAQIAGLKAGNVGMTTAADTGDWFNIHPPDKQNPSSRLANQALTQIYNKTIAGADFPMYAGSTLKVSGSAITVTIAIRAGGKLTKLTTDAPVAATQSSTLGKPGSVPRNQCITVNVKTGFPEDCGYPQILGTVAGKEVYLNATATVGSDGSTLVLAATAPAGFTPLETSYGRASWPMTIFFSTEGDKLPVIPWHSNFTNTEPWGAGVLGRTYTEPIVDQTPDIGSFAGQANKL